MQDKGLENGWMEVLELSSCTNYRMMHDIRSPLVKLCSLFVVGITGSSGGRVAASPGCAYSRAGLPVTKQADFYSLLMRNTQMYIRIAAPATAVMTAATIAPTGGGM